MRNFVEISLYFFQYPLYKGQLQATEQFSSHRDFQISEIQFAPILVDLGIPFEIFIDIPIHGGYVLDVNVSLNAIANIQGNCPL